MLLDACVWGGAKRILAQAGHDVIHVGEWPQDPGDDQLLALAYRESRVLVTLDKDFGELIFLRRMEHAGVIRLVGFRAGEQGEASRLLLERYTEDLAGGAIITAEPTRVRIRRPT